MYKKSEVLIDYYIAKQNLSEFRLTGECQKKGASELDLLKLKTNIQEVNLEAYVKIFESTKEGYEVLGYTSSGNQKNVIFYYINLDNLLLYTKHIKLSKFYEYLSEVEKIEEAQHESKV